MKKIKVITIFVLGLLLMVSCNHVYMLQSAFKVSFDAGEAKWGDNAEGIALVRPSESAQSNGDFIVPGPDNLIPPKAGIDGVTEDKPHFLGWEYNGKIYKQGDIINVKGPVTIVAKWEANRAISFFPGLGNIGKELFPVLETIKGGKVQLPANTGDHAFIKPTKPIAGRSFVGWSVKIGDGAPQFVKAGEFITLSDNAEATALWTPVYQIRYHEGEGKGGVKPSGTMPTSEVAALAGAKHFVFESTGLTPPKNHRFLGWRVVEGPFESYVVKPGAQLDVTGDLDLTAEWAYRWTISFDKGTNPLDTTRDDDHRDDGEVFPIPSNTFTVPTGQHFLGWKLKDAKGERDIKAGARYRVNSNILLTAQWSAPVSIGFDNGGNGATGAMADRIAATGRFVVPFPELGAPNIVPPPKSEFVGWKIVKKADGKPYGNDKKDIAAPGDIITLSEDIKLIAQWKGQWNVTFFPNGGSGTMKNDKLGIDDTDTARVQKGHYYTLPPCSFVAPSEPAGREFIGWRIGKTKYAAGKRILVTSDVEVHAEWTPYFRVRYVANDGEADGKLNPVANQYIAKAGSVSLRTPTYKVAPKRSKFLGWLVRGELKKPGEEIPVFENVTLEGMWENSYKVEFILNDGVLFPIAESDLKTTPKAQFVKGGETAVNPVDPSKPETTPKLWRYKFLGWYEQTDKDNYSAEAKNKPFDFNTPIKTGKVLYARWGKKPVADRAALVREIYGENDDSAHATDSALHDSRWSEYKELNYIDTSKVTSFKHIFAAMEVVYAGSALRPTEEGTHVRDHARVFSGDISKWDMSAAADTSYMFQAAREFNGDIQTKGVRMYDGKMYLAWDLRNNQNAEYMFHDAQSFDKPLNNWDISKVQNVKNMFLDASTFDQDLSNWDIRSVKSDKLKGMFCAARRFKGNISTWDISHITSLECFLEGTRFNGSLERKENQQYTHSYLDLNADKTAVIKRSVEHGSYTTWDPSKVVTLQRFVDYAQQFEGKGLASWGGHISSLNNINTAFYDTFMMKEDLSSWHLSATAKRTKAFKNNIKWDLAKYPQFDLP